MGSYLGALKGTATRAGISLDEYLALVAAGQKWCTACKGWHLRSEFGADRSRSDGLSSSCIESRTRRREGVPTRRERRERAAKGELWCRGCKAWLSGTPVLRGACHPCVAAEARANYRGPAGAAIRAQKLARKRGLDPIPAWWREECFEDFGHLCAYGCGRAATSIDHIWPVARGGRSVLGNLVPACTSCNSSKNDSDPLPWVEKGLNFCPGPWVDVVALAVEHSTDEWLGEIFNA